MGTLYINNEYAPLETVALARPARYLPTTIEEAKILNFKKPVNQEIFLQNHEALVNVIKKNGADIVFLDDYLDPHEKAVAENLPNRVFVRDIAAVVLDKICIGYPAFKPRTAEFDLMQKALKRYLETHINFKEHFSTIPIDSYLEFGDYLQISEDTILINCGLRTKTEDFNNVINLFYKLGIKTVGVTMLPHENNIIHLDLACHMVGSKIVIGLHFLNFLPIYVYRKNKPQDIQTFTEFFKNLGCEARFFQATEQNQFLTNFINLNPETILINHRYASEIKNILCDHPLGIETVDIDEIEKGSGSIHCLTLPLKRTFV